MASGLLLIAITVFAARGFFLGFVGVIGKVLGLVCGYVIALSFRTRLATWVGTQTTLDVPAMVLEIGCGVALFFVTLLLVGFAVSLCASLLKKIMPVLSPVLENNSTAGRITGALGNGLLGAAIVLIGIWGYGQLGKGSVEPPRLQQVANLFGNAVFTLTNTHFTGSAGKPVTVTPATSTYNTFQGSASISSASTPDKKLTIETIRQEPAVTQALEQNSQLKALFASEQVQQLLKNPHIQQLAMDQLKNNPEKLTALSSKTDLNPEALKQLLEKLQSQQ